MAVTIKLKLDSKSIGKGLSKVSSDFKASSAKMNSISQGLASKALIAGAAFTGIGLAIGKIVGIAAEMEKTQIQFEVLTGSATKAKNIMQELSDFSAKTPFQFGDIASAAKKLIGFGFQAEEVVGHLQNLGDVSAAVGTPLGELATVFGQVKAAGKLTGERLLQFQERAVPIGAAIAKTMGVAETSVKEMVSQGKVDFKTFEKAFKSISAVGGLAFEGMIKASKTTSGVISTLKDNFNLFVVDIGNNFLPEVKAVALALTSFFQKVKQDKELLKMIANILKLTAAFFGAKLIIFTVGAIVAKVLAVKMAIAGGAVKAFSLAVSASSKIMKIAGLVSKVFAALMSGNLTKALKVAKLGMTGLKFAVRGLIGATGIGLLITFLPEILQFFSSFWDDFVRIGKAAMDGFIKLFSGFKNLFKAAVSLDLDGFKKGLGEMKDAFVGFYKSSTTIIKKAKQEKEESDIDPAEEVRKAKVREVAEKEAADRKKANEAVLREEDIDKATDHAAVLFELGIENDEIEKEYGEEKYEADTEIREQREQELIAIARKGALSKNQEDVKAGEQAGKILKRRHDKEVAVSKAQYSAIKSITINGLSAIAAMDGKYKQAAFLASKAFAVSDIIIKTAQGVADAGSRVITQPLIPLIIAQGAVQVALVAAQTFTVPAAQKGGIVGRAFGTQAMGDNQLMAVETDELITPGDDVARNREASKIIVESQKNSDESFFEEDREAAKIDVNFEGKYSSIMVAEQRENTAIGIGVV